MIRRLDRSTGDPVGHRSPPDTAHDDGGSPHRGANPAHRADAALVRPHCALPRGHWTPGLFATSCVFAGLDLGGATLLRQLLAAGCATYALFDRQEFGEADVGVECGPEEVGRPRAVAIGARLARRGAHAAVITDTLSTLVAPPGPASFVGVGSEEASIVAEAHRFAHRHSLPLFRAMTRPARGEFAVIGRRHDLPRDGVARCPECDAKFSPFSGDRTPTLCDPLESAAAGWTTLLIEAALRGESPPIGDGEVVLLAPSRGTITRRRLPACRCEGSEGIAKGTVARERGRGVGLPPGA